MAIFGRGRKKQDESTAAASGPAVEELNAAEVEWLQGMLDELTAAGVDSTDPASLERYYDETYTRWTQQPDADRADPNPIINRVGAGLGQYLVARTGLRWVLATDEYGTELALHGQPGNVVIFPPNMVGKRWAAGETGFLVGLADFTARRVAECNAADRHVRRATRSG